LPIKKTLPCFGEKPKRRQVFQKKHGSVRSTCRRFLLPIKKTLTCSGEKPERRQVFYTIKISFSLFLLKKFDFR